MSVDTYHLPTPSERPDKRNSAARPPCIMVHLDCLTQFLGFYGFLKNACKGDAQLASDPTVVSWLVETGSAAIQTSDRWLLCLADSGTGWGSCELSSIPLLGNEVLEACPFSRVVLRKLLNEIGVFCSRQ